MLLSLRFILAGECLAWLVFIIFYAYRFGLNDWQHGIIAALLAIDCAAFGFFTYMLKKDTLAIRILASLFLFANAVLSIADQVGFFDYAVLIANLSALAICIALFFVKEK